jgi:hypothetical protein
MEAKNVIFISHAAADQDIAALLKLEIHPCFPEADVFVSSDPGSLPPRSAWAETILNRLHRAAIIIVVATERALKRPWVWFEAGAGWQRGVTQTEDIHKVPAFLSCCLGTQEKGKLPAPFSIYQSLNIGNPDDLGLMFIEIAKAVGVQKSAPDYESLALKLRKVEISVAEASDRATDPILADQRRRVSEQILALDADGQEAIYILARDGQANDANTLAELHQKGLAKSNPISIFEGLSTRTNLVSMGSGQADRMIRTEQKTWVINPTLRQLVLDHFADRSQRAQ